LCRTSAAAVNKTAQRRRCSPSSSSSTADQAAIDRRADGGASAVMVPSLLEKYRDLFIRPVDRRTEEKRAPHDPARFRQ
jgi:hypothetical protein